VTLEEQRLVAEYFQYLKGAVDDGVGLLVGRTMATDEQAMRLRRSITKTRRCRVGFFGAR